MDNQNPQQPHTRRPGLVPEFERAVARKHILDARPGDADLNKNNREPRAVRQAHGGAWTTKTHNSPTPDGRASYLNFNARSHENTYTPIRSQKYILYMNRLFLQGTRRTLLSRSQRPVGVRVLVCSQRPINLVLVFADQTRLDASASSSALGFAGAPSSSRPSANG